MDNDKRREYRLPSTATVFIETVAQAHDGSQPAEILISNSVDLSANGLQITSDQPLMVNSIHQAAITLDSASERMALTIQVRWVKLNETDQQYHIGLEVLEDSDSQLAAWKRDLSERLLDDLKNDVDIKFD